MSSAYPGAVTNPSRPVAGPRSDSPGELASINQALDEAFAIETELGVNPSGADATVAARLTAIDAAIDALEAPVGDYELASGETITDPGVTATITRAVTNNSAARTLLVFVFIRHVVEGAVNAAANTQAVSGASTTAGTTNGNVPWATGTSTNIGGSWREANLSIVTLAPGATHTEVVTTSADASLAIPVCKARVVLVGIYI